MLWHIQSIFPHFQLTMRAYLCCAGMHEVAPTAHPRQRSTQNMPVLGETLAAVLPLAMSHQDRERPARPLSITPPLPVGMVLYSRRSGAFCSMLRENG